MPIEVPFGLTLAATLVGAVQGALLAAADDDIDVTGMIVLALSLGFGGGIIRDVLVGDLPPVAIREPWYVLGALAMAGVVWLAGSWLRRYEGVFLVADAGTLGLFAVLGVDAALVADVSFVGACFVGTVASVGGGVVADILRRERPMILRPGPPYALAAVVGATSYATCVELGMRPGAATVVAVALTFATRLVAWRLGVLTRPAQAARRKRLDAGGEAAG